MKPTGYVSVKNEIKQQGWGGGSVGKGLLALQFEDLNSIPSQSRCWVLGVPADRQIPGAHHPAALTYSGELQASERLCLRK